MKTEMLFKHSNLNSNIALTLGYLGTDLGGGCRGCASPPPEMTCGFLIQLVFYKKKKKTMWFIGVEVEQETSAPPPKKHPGTAPVILTQLRTTRPCSLIAGIKSTYQHCL